ncbi:MAG TPA: DUF4388 domain-containing protein, partial [Thermoanaerobaculia bacterium]|nr:DUF4388 domain-containing protein [Thermoanaerobaculia bacterium]
SAPKIEEGFRELGNEDVAFLFRSALGDMPQRVLGLRTGADDFIVKSGNLDELLLKVRLSIEKCRKTKLLRELAESKRPIGILSGRLGEVPVAELLQIVAFLDLSGVCISLQSESHASGAVYLDHGRVVHAETRNAKGGKAFARILRFTDGVFHVARRAFAGEPTMNESLEKCLLDGLVRVDRTRELESRVRPRGSSFRLGVSADVLTRRFDEETARFLALVTDGQNLDELLDECPADDDQILSALGDLLDAGVITSRTAGAGSEADVSENALSPSSR